MGVVAEDFEHPQAAQQAGFYYEINLGAANVAGKGIVPPRRDLGQRRRSGRERRGEARGDVERSRVDVQPREPARGKAHVHVVVRRPVTGGVELGFKYKQVDDTNKGQAGNATDDRDTKDTGWGVSAGNQLFGDLYGKLAWGKYKRDITKSGSKIENDKSITSLGLAYNLAGFEVGLLTQWVSGDGDPNETGTKGDIEQYRMKAFVKAIF